MGRALKNLDQLLRMPSGCGEQNMIVLAPNIYILRYLEVTAQLTTAIRATATGYLQSGMEKNNPLISTKSPSPTLIVVSKFVILPDQVSVV